MNGINLSEEEKTRIAEISEKSLDALSNIDKLDKFIHEHLHRFGENNLFRASLDNFRDTGKASGSFRAALRAMLEEYKKPIPSPSEQSAEEILRKNMTKNFPDMSDEEWTETIDESEGMMDYIMEAMEEYKSLSQSQEGWVSVEERLPEIGQEVLAVNKNSSNTVLTDVHYFVNGFVTHPFGYDYDKELLTGITHWQPLPSPPKS